MKQWEREWADVVAEAQAAARENEEKHGWPSPYPPGAGLHEIKQIERERCDRVLETAVLAGEMLGHRDLVGMVTRFGRVHGPATLYVLDSAGLLKPGAYRKSVPYVWGLAEFPGLAMGRPEWRSLWRKAGFTVDGKKADRPTEPLQLYRGSTNEHKRNFSWTADRSKAEWFVKARSFGSQQAHLWTALVPPDRLLGYIHESGRGEDEWVVDTLRLDIALVE